MRFKSVHILSILVLTCFHLNAQVGDDVGPGSVFLAATSIGNVDVIGKSDLPVCTPRGYACNTPASLNYIFVGAGNWDIPENWTNNLIPPSTLPKSYEITINPRGTSECILNVSQTIGEGAKLTVLPGKKLKVP